MRSRRALNLIRFHLTALPDSIGQLSNLQTLNLTLTDLTSLPDSIGQLAKLHTLSLNATKLTTLPDSIGQLSNLQRLNLSFTQLISLPDSIGQLSNLQRLDLSFTQLISLPDSMVRLSKLEVLDLKGSKIEKLSDWLGRLPALRHLDLKGLTLPALPESLARLGLPFVEKEIFPYDEKGINLYHTTLTQQDKSIFLESPSLIPTLYVRDEEVPLRECKVIFLGDGSVGKSYTIRRIRNGGKRETQAERELYRTEETHGVEIGDLPVDRGADSFTIHFWDFGGQEILYSMHRCFLTEDTCYVVTLRTRDVESTPRAKYWLRTIRSYAPRSPVLLFVNCWENATGEQALNETELMQEFGDQIKGVVYCSAKRAETQTFREKLMKPILDMAAASEICSKPFNRRWDALRRAIREAQARAIRDHQENYLSREAYYGLCKDQGIPEAQASDLLSYFNNLGLCFSYHRDEDRVEFADYKLLNPTWLTNALYAIVEEGSDHAQEGRIPLRSIQTMLRNRAPERLRKESYRRMDPDMQYEDPESQYILDVAESFLLCYRLDGDTVFFPSLCKANTPVAVLEEAEEYPLRGVYCFRYDYLPDSVLHQLMIRCLRKGYAIRHCWLSGMELGRLEHHRAIVRSYEDEGLLKLELYGRDDHPLYELLPMLREEIQSINGRLRLNPRETIQDGRDELPVGQLLALHRKGTKETIGNNSFRPIAVLPLLERFFDAWTMARMELVEGRIHMRPYRYHQAGKDKPALRRAIWETYGKKCQYCGKPIGYDELQIDHILAAKHAEPGDSHVKLYLAELKKNYGFDLEKPDYVENYFPACAKCNREKSNETRSAVTLREYHAIALGRSGEVLRAWKEYEKRLKEKPF